MPKMDLSERSECYYAEAGIYDLFSRCEDAPARVFSLLLPRIEGKTLLDLGCGSGKYVRLFAPRARAVIGVDASARQLEIAAECTKDFPSVRLIRASAERTGLPAESADVILCSWMLGTIADPRRRMRAVREAERLLKPGGMMFFVENDEGGEFEDIRGRTDDPLKRTEAYNEWLVSTAGLTVCDRIASWFEFASLDETRRVIAAIWGDEAAGRVRSRRIEHRIIIFAKNVPDTIIRA